MKEVGDYLGHRHHSSTAIYAKVDAAMLHEVVQPWPVPGGAK